VSRTSINLHVESVPFGRYVLFEGTTSLERCSKRIKHCALCTIEQKIYILENYNVVTKYGETVINMSLLTAGSVNAIGQEGAERRAVHRLRFTAMVNLPTALVIWTAGRSCLFLAVFVIRKCSTK
jgi:hypothetical protein